MPRRALTICLSAALVLVAQTAQAQDALPGGFTYGTGHYLAWWKLLPIWLLFLFWVRTLNWMNQDGQRLKLAYRKYNQLEFFPFLAIMASTWFLPVAWGFWLVLPLLLAAYLVPFVMYVKVRNVEVMSAEKVFTMAHYRRWFSANLKPLGMNIASEKEEDNGPPVEFTSKGAKTERDDSINLLNAKQHPGYPSARQVMATLFENQAGAVMLDFSQQSVALQHQLDGVWHKGENLERETGDAVLEVLKTIAGLQPQERRARQLGFFDAAYERGKYACKIVSQGTKTGERVLVQLIDQSVKTKRFPDLGMREKMQEELKEVLERKHGFVLVSAPPGGGLSSLLTSTVGAMDRFMRSFVVIEETNNRDLEVENVPCHPFDAAAGQVPATVLPKLLLEYPDVLVVPDLVDAASGNMLLVEGAEDRMVVVAIRAKEACEALLRTLMLKVSPTQFAAAITASLNMRLVRTLCDACKEAYAPPPQLLAQLQIPAGRVEALYRPPPTPEDPKEICAKCNGLGYKGRTGIFEFLVVDDRVRESLLNKPQLDAVRSAARKGGMKTLQEEGLVHVVKGLTSLEELRRVLKE